MEIVIAVALVLVGFFLLMWSADLLVDNASDLASNLGISTFLVGIVIVGFGTSAPELFVSAMAALENKGNLALGNAIGSNITNIGMVLGSAAFIRALTVQRSTATIDIPVVIATSILAIAIVADGLLSRLDGVILLTILVAYLVWSALGSKKVEENSTTASDNVSGTGSNLKSGLLTVVSIVVLMAASKMLVNGAMTIAEFFGVGELIIGLTIVAIGTSLPELAAAIAAARKGVHDMIIGNIIGSNVFNTLGVLGLTGVIQATEIDTSALWRDFPVMLAFTVFMLIFALTKGTFSRKEGGIMLCGYATYLGYLVYATV
jgi:cation:H+ antiporter